MYINASVYREQATENVCDDCLRPDEFDTYTYPDGYVHRHQKAPWCWWPDAMSGGYTCSRCGRIQPSHTNQ